MKGPVCLRLRHGVPLSWLCGGQGPLTGQLVTAAVAPRHSLLWATMQSLDSAVRLCVLPLLQVLPFWKHELFQAIVVVAGLVFGYIHVWQPSHDHRIATSASLASLQKGQSVLEKGLSVVEADVKEIKAGQSVLEMGQSVMEKSQSVVEADLKDIKSVLQAMQLSLAEQRGGSSSSSQAAMLDRLLQCCGVGVIVYFCRTC